MTDSVSEMLQSMIAAGARAGAVTTEVRISDKAARQLAEEMAPHARFPKPRAAVELYQSMVAGTARFMDRAIVVARK